MINLDQVDQEQMEKILGYVESGKQVVLKKRISISFYKLQSSGHLS